MYTQVCTKCSVEQPVTNFRWQNKSKGIYQRWCKTCAALHEKDAWANNKMFRDKRNMEKAARIERNRAFFKDLMTNIKCVECGFADQRAIHFDHIDRKTKWRNIADLKSSTYSLERIQQELAKCRPLCANCHAIHTYEQMGFFNAD